MQQSITEKAGDTSNTLNNVEKTHNNNSNLIERKPIEASPFYIVRQVMDNDKVKYFMTMGDYRLTEPTDTEDQTMIKLVTEHWNIVANIIAITTDKMIEIKQLTKQQTQYETESL